MKLRLRTKFLLSMLLVSSGLTCTSLLLVHRIVQAQIRRELFSDLHNSVVTFQSFQSEREKTLSHSADLLADLPDLRALMTTQDEATIQDGSSALWQLAGGDLFVLANRTGQVVALHSNAPEFTRAMAEASFAASLRDQGFGHWWYGAHHLYQVFVKPIYFGPASEDNRLGFLVVGYEIDDAVAARISRVASSQVAFYYGNAIVRSTLSAAQEEQLVKQGPLTGVEGHDSSGELLDLGGERFAGASLELGDYPGQPVGLTVLKSYDRAANFLDRLNRLLLGLGLAAVLGGSLLVYLISDTFTRPLGSLVAGVRALEKGDFNYKLDARSSDEVGELTGAFDRMRQSLRTTQQELLEAERLATIGRMASSISHDLRHSLAAIVANAEFLCEARLSSEQREDLYQEVRAAVTQMTDLIDSLLEFSRTRESLRPSYGSVKASAERAVQAIRQHPQFQSKDLRISVSEEGESSGNFDQRKLERVLFNLLLNACEAVPNEGGQIELRLGQLAEGMEIRVIDNGRGIPEAMRTKIFEPFVSFGKENGTGLGLTVVQKIVEDHGGKVMLESTSDRGTTFCVRLPLQGPSDYGEQALKKPATRTPAEHAPAES